MNRFQRGDVVPWKVLNGTAYGKVVMYDTLGLGLMLVRLRSGRNMIVHESNARPYSLTVAELS